MKKALLLIITVAFALGLSAQDVKGKYIIRSVDNSTILFIYPQEGYKSKTMSSKLVYDATYSSATDSVSVNFTYTQKIKTPSPLDSMVIVSGENRYSLPATMFYVEPKKGDKWENRASVKLKADDFKSIFSEESPAQLTLYINQEEHPFEISEKEWKKSAGIINKIFEIAKYNF